MRQLLALIFLFILSLQVLPVREIGKLMCKSQATEDVQNDDAGNDDDALGVAALFSTDCIINRTSFEPVYTTHYIDTRVSVTIRTTEDLPSVFINSIPAPPPDLA